jgi:hypothetical protein
MIPDTRTGGSGQGGDSCRPAQLVSFYEDDLLPFLPILFIFEFGLFILGLSLMFCYFWSGAGVWELQP